MNKIYIVLIRKFFNSNGCDYAMPIDTLRDINVFTSKKKALEFHDKLVEETKNIFKGTVKKIDNKTFDESFFINIDEIDYGTSRAYVSTNIKYINK